MILGGGMETPPSSALVQAMRLRVGMMGVCTGGRSSLGCAILESALPGAPRPVLVAMGDSVGLCV